MKYYPEGIFAKQCEFLGMWLGRRMRNSMKWFGIMLGIICKGFLYTVGGLLAYALYVKLLAKYLTS